MAVQPDLNRLQSQLIVTGLQKKDNPLFQVITQLIKAVKQLQDATLEDISNVTNTINNTPSNPVVQMMGFLEDNSQEEMPLSSGGGAPTSSNAMVTNEVPSGSIDGSNKLFIVAHSYVSNTLRVYLNGVRQEITSDYVENTDTQFTFVDAPLPGDIVLVDYNTSNAVQGPVGPPGSAAGRIFYLDPLTASDIAGYKVAFNAPSANAETTLTVAATGTGDNLLASFATQPNVPDVSVLPAGTAFRHFHVDTGGSSQVCRLLFNLYKCDANGANETLLRSGYSPNISGTGNEVQWDFSDTNSFALGLTQRLVFKVFAARVSGPTTCNITVYFDGTARTAYVQTTITVGLRGDQGPIGIPGDDGGEGEILIIPGPVGPTGAAGGTDFVKISQIVTTGSQSTVDFTSIAATYSSLLVEFTSTDTAAGTSSSLLRLKVNNDGTAGNYTSTSRTAASNQTAFTSDVAASTKGGYIGSHPNAGADANNAATGSVLIVGYAGARKRIMGLVCLDEATNNGTIVTFSFRWKSTTAISRLTFGTDGTAFADGSVFTLYGRK